jgi:hypothetical protein
MSTKTNFKRIALVAVTALGAGVLSVAPANAAAGQMTLVTANGPVIVAGTVAQTSAGTITIGSTTSIQLKFEAGTDEAGKATVEGGTIIAASKATDAASGISTSTSFVYGDLVDTLITFLPDAGVGVMIVRSYANGSTETGTFTATIKAAASIGVVSAGNSLVRIANDTSDSGVSDSVDSTTGGRSVAVTSNARINYSLKDGNNVAMPSTTAVTATATGGCVVGMANAAGNLISVSATELAASGDIYVARSVTNGAFTCTVTITANGLPVASKTVTLQGKVTKLEVIGGQDGISNAYASSTVNSGVSEDAFTYNAYDAAGNIVYSITPTFNNTASAAFTSTSNSAAATLAVGYGKGNITCSGVARGSGTFYLSYPNNAGETIKSPTYTANCFGKAVTYAASFDKASYVPGDIATLTITAKDASGNPVNDYVYLGGTDADGTGTTLAPSIAGSNMTAITAPTSTDLFSGGKKTYKFVVGSTTGSYQMAIDLPKFNSSTYSQAAITVAYKIATSTTAVSNEDVLKAIVSLIASINKQIAALQKALLRR